MPATMPRRPRRPNLGKRALQPTLTPPTYPAITTLAELETLCQTPVVVECVIGDKPVRFEGRRLRPCEERQVQELLTSAFPPELPPETPGGEPRYDFRNPEYLAKKETARRTARALALWYAFPLFHSELGPDAPRTPEQILAFVEGRAVDVSLLDLAFELVTREIVRVDPRRVAFTSGSSSPAS